MSKFRIGLGDWTQYRALPGLMEVDLHLSDNRQSWDEPPVPYWEKMNQVEGTVLRELEDGFNDPDTQHILFMHGWATSQNGKQTTRSVVRGIMRGKAATPYIDRRCCIQHYSVFVAALKQRKR